MENIATKKFTYDHASSYKARGKLGVSNRNVRAQRATENRHQSRMDAVSKRRRMPLSPMADENVVDAINGAVESKNDKQKDNTSQPELSRREKLLKWREERKLKKGTEHQTKSFIVRHVKHNKDANLFASSINKATKGVMPLIKPSQYGEPVDKPAKRVTRASVRIAKQASSNLPDDLKSHTAKKMEPKSKVAATEKIKEKVEVKPEKNGIVTRQRLRTKTPPAPASKSVVTPQSSKVVPESKNQVKTRLQAKKQKDLSPSEMCHSKPNMLSEQTSATEQNTPNCDKANFPALDAIKNTVSVGRGSSEGVDRGQPCMGSGNETDSFAPADFQFTAPNGVNSFNCFSKTFKFQPLSPNSAAEFMFPTSSASLFSPEKPDEKKAENPILEDPVAAFNKSITSTENEKQQSVNTNADVDTDVAMETHSEPEKHQEDIEVLESDRTACLSVKVNPDTLQQSDHELVGEMVTGMENGEVVEPQDVGEQHDATYFRNLVKNETVQLNEICAKWEKISAEEQNLSEEVTGQIRTTIGQGQLLIDQRFRQFSGLIDMSEDKNAERKATASDLQGFWEMIYFQVEDVNAKFAALEKLKENNWKEEEKKAKKVTRKTKAKKPTAGNDAKASSKVTATRNRIQEMRKAMKAKMVEDKEKVKIEKRPQEEEAFVTILTPMKKSKTNDGTDEEVVLTPVRRSIRKTPQKQSAFKHTPTVVTTPKIISEDSPGLRLTPDNTTLSNELAVIGTSVEAEETREEATHGETSDEDACGSGVELQLKEDEMECDLGQQALKSACKSTVNASRKTPGKVTFQSPAELEDQQKTPECTENTVAVSLAQVNPPADCTSLETDVSERRTSTSRRFSGRKCRGRVSTPYHQHGPRRRVSAVDEGEGGQSEEQSSSESDSSDAKAKGNCPRSGLRRSLRRTPSKYRDSTTSEPAEADHGGKTVTPADISVKLFHAAEVSTTGETPREDSEQDALSKYICASSCDEEECAKKPVTLDNMADNVFEEETKPEDCPVNGEVTLTPPEEPENFIRPRISNSAPKTGRTPIHILRYLSDLDTPSPNSRQITPMPKTTIFAAGSSKTPALADSLGMMSPANVVRRFPAQSEASPLLSLSDVAGKGSRGSMTPSSQLAAFHLNSPANDGNRRDSVFFAPPSAAEAARAPGNLMSFSPVAEGVNEEQD